jgi:hypothetical protein
MCHISTKRTAYTRTSTGRQRSHAHCGPTCRQPRHRRGQRGVMQRSKVPLSKVILCVFIAPTVSSTGTLLGPLELIWADFDDLLADFDEADWARVHGPDWRLEDIPFHLAYFDREVIARPIVAGDGPNAPTGHVFRTLGELNKWNDSFFAARPTDQTVEQSLAEMHAARNEIRDALSDDRAAGSPVFVSLPAAGWIDAAGAVKRIRTHSWNHFAEARVRHGRPAPVPEAGIVHDAIGANLAYRPLFCVADESTPPLAARLSVQGHGGGDWVIQIHDGVCRVIEDAYGIVDKRPPARVRYRSKWRVWPN